MKRFIAAFSVLLLAAFLVHPVLADSTISQLPSGGLVNPLDVFPDYNPNSPGQNFGVTFGSAAAYSIGTSGSSIGLLNTANTWSAQQSFLSGDLIAADADFIGASITLPAGATSSRPASPVNGMIRYNTTTPGFEGYANNAWGPIGSGGGGSFSLTSSGPGIVLGTSPWTGGTTTIGLGAPGTSTFGGILAAASASANQFVTYIDTSGVQHTAQVGFSNLSGTASNAQIPAPTTTGIGGLLALASATANEVVSYIDNTGVQHLVQLAFSNISGTLTNSQLPTSGVSAGSYTNANVTFNAQGIATAASNGSGGGGGMVYPGAGIGNSTGSAWGTSYSVTGTGSVLAAAGSPTFTGTVTLPAGQIVNGVTLTTGGSATAYLNGAGAYTTPSGGGNVNGPGSSTSGYVPLWNGTSGTLLSAGLPVGQTGNSTIVETNSGGAVTAVDFVATGSSPPTVGLYNPASNTVGLSALSLPVVEGLGVSSSVNYLLATNAATGALPSLNAAGSDIDISFNMSGQRLGFAESNGNVPFYRNVTPSFLPHWNKCIAQVEQNAGNCIAACVGDSLTAGYGSSGASTSTNNTINSWCYQMARYMNDQMGINTSWQSWLGSGQSGTGRASVDFRVTVGSGWTGGGTLTIGGPFYTASSSTSNLGFAATQPVDTFEYCYRTTSGGGTFSVKIDSGSATNVSTSGSEAFTCASINTSVVGTHSMNVNYVSGGTVSVAGGWAWNSHQSQIIFVNAGWGGESAVGWTTPTGGATASGQMAALTAIAPQLTFLTFDNIDALNASGQSAYQTALNTLITTAQQSGAGDVILQSDTAFNTGVISWASQQAYDGYNIQTANSYTPPIPYLDFMMAIYNAVPGSSDSWSAAHSLGMVADSGTSNYHVNGAGHGWWARFVENAILPVGAGKVQYSTVQNQGWPVLNFPYMSVSSGSDYTSLGVGAFALYGQTASSANNTAVGGNALLGDTTGSNNEALGYNALDSVTTGTNNFAIGPGVASNLTTGQYNGFLGVDSSCAASSAAASNTFEICGQGGNAWLSATGTNGTASLALLATITGATWHGNALTSTYLPTDVAYVDVAQSWTAGQAVTPTAGGTQSPGGTYTPNFASSNSVTLTFGAGNLTIANPTNIKAGQTYNIALTQDGVGSRTASWGSYFKWTSGAPTLSTGANDKDVIACWADTATTLNCVLMGANFH